MTMIEKVARAITLARYHGLPSEMLEDEDDIHWWGHQADDARAAIEALAANVTDEMVNAYYRERWKQVGLSADEPSIKDTLSASLRAALSEDKGA